MATKQRGNKMSARKKVGLAGTYLLWSAMTVFTLGPIYWMFSVSSRSPVEVFDKPSLFIDSFYWQNYLEVFEDRVVRGYLINSLVVSTTNAVVVTVLGFMAAYAFTRFKLPGADSIFFWTITNRMGPPAAFILPLFLIMTQVAVAGDWMLFDTRIGLILIYCLFNLPFAIWLLKGILDGIPIELDEAALLDRASRFQVITKIIVPLSAPGLAITFILTWIFAWNEYLFAATLSAANARTITTRLAEYVTTTGTNYGELAAVAFIATLPAIIFLVFIQRYIVTGLTFGAVKD
jgi:multiple sugar transport system permease protein